MTASHDDVVAAMTCKLERLAPLVESDRQALAALPYTIRSVTAGHYLVREGRNADHCCLLVEGYACRYKTTRDGGRQIVSFHVRGDILDLQQLLVSTSDHNIRTITRATIACIPAAAFRGLAREHPAIGDALWRDTLIDASVFREWVLNVGRRDARSRVAHMLCEFAARAEAAGLGTPDSFHLPMTQEQIADATGLTPVHVNRMLQALGAEGVIKRTRRQVVVADWKRLRAIADFDPAYLHGAAAAA